MFDWVLNTPLVYTFQTKTSKHQDVVKEKANSSKGLGHLFFANAVKCKFSNRIVVKVLYQNPDLQQRVNQNLVYWGRL